MAARERRIILLRLTLAAVALTVAAFGSALSAGAPLRFDPATLAQVIALGPWPPAAAHDASNRVSGQPRAIAFGEVLFHSARLSSVGGLRCASCHEPWRGFTDGRALGLGAAPGARNTLSLHNVGQQRWFGWDGANDSLWAQSIRPLLDPREMGVDAAHVGALVRGDAALARLYAQAFGAAPAAGNDEALLVDIGKALAAYEETIVTPRTPFDAFRDALERGDGDAAAARYPRDAQRGLALFVGRGRCIACHTGAGFRDGLFHRSRIVSTLADGTPDTGRAAGIKHLAASRYTRLGRFNDAPADPSARALESAPGDAGAVNDFRTPGLREVALTGPYMHDGSVVSLCEAMRPHAALAGDIGSGEAAPELSSAERRDLVAFLLTLSARELPPFVDRATLACP